MEIEFGLREEDILAFSEYHTDHSPSVQRSVQRQRVLFPSFLFILGIYLMWREGDWLIGIIFFPILLLIMAVWFIWFPKRFKYNYRQAAIKLYRERGNEGVLGAHRLRIESDGLYEACSSGEGKTYWTAIQGIESTETHTFIYSGSVKAIIIPRQAVTRGEYDQFVQAVRSEHQQAVSRSLSRPRPEGAGIPGSTDA